MEESNSPDVMKLVKGRKPDRGMIPAQKIYRKKGHISVIKKQ
jgi:hypothetical protein